MWKKLCIVALIVTLGRSETVEKGSLDDLIDGVFSKASGNDDAPKPCNGGAGECVPYYLVS